ncbi:MAG: hypothetical protein LBU90_04290 [Bacteroidales bacterium]|jgi:hypothetical protein|nr:hypothetical protein [Bacteroidales bacterium]
MNKIIKPSIYFFFAALLLVACKDTEEVFPTYESPVWNVNHSAGYYENMTAVVKLPDNLTPYTSEDDHLAAFAGNECRGVGVLINGVYFVSVKGSPEDQSNIRFMYYGAKNKYLYQTDDLLSFDADVIFGTVDEPKVLTLKVIK